MNTQILRSKLVDDLTVAYSIMLPEPDEFILTPYWQSAFPAVIGNLTNLSIRQIAPRHRMGRVYSFDAVPKVHPDPIIIMCNTGDLRSYYSLWSEAVSNLVNRRMDMWGNGGGNFSKSFIRKYNESIRTFIGTADLTAHEACFAVIEMLKFKNDCLL